MFDTLKKIKLIFYEVLETKKKIEELTAKVEEVHKELQNRFPNLEDVKHSVNSDEKLWLKEKNDNEAIDLYKN
uniref:Uncharacterized protein n=1 Tax=viral metagenome TaxID=1070528 RepID=A0A6M3LMJ8_9ZZZZ